MIGKEFLKLVRGFGQITSGKPVYQLLTAVAVIGFFKDFANNIKTVIVASFIEQT